MDDREDVLDFLEEAAADGADVTAVLASLAGEGLAIDDDERNAAVRRALLLLAAGGDPHRDVGLDSRPVAALAGDLDTPERRAALAGGLAALPLDGRPALAGQASGLLADPGLAWRAYAAAVLADELAD